MRDEEKSEEEVTEEKEEIIEISTHAIHGESNFFFLSAFKLQLQLLYA